MVSVAVMHSLPAGNLHNWISITCLSMVIHSYQCITLLESLLSSAPLHLCVWRHDQIWYWKFWVWGVRIKETSNSCSCYSWTPQKSLLVHMSSQTLYMANICHPPWLWLKGSTITATTLVQTSTMAVHHAEISHDKVKISTIQRLVGLVHLAFLFSSKPDASSWYAAATYLYKSHNQTDHAPWLPCFSITESTISLRDIWPCNNSSFMIRSAMSPCRFFTHRVYFSNRSRDAMLPMMQEYSVMPPALSFTLKDTTFCIISTARASFTCKPKNILKYV